MFALLLVIEPPTVAFLYVCAFVYLCFVFETRAAFVYVHVCFVFITRARAPSVIELPTRLTRVCVCGCMCVCVLVCVSACVSVCMHMGVWICVCVNHLT